MTKAMQWRVATLVQELQLWCKSYQFVLLLLTFAGVAIVLCCLVWVRNPMLATPPRPISKHPDITNRNPNIASQKKG
eukprot:6004324-Amphidinium_carterae.1